MFKTPQGQARYLAAYDATLALWPVAVESFPVPTRFGTTHVNACGPRTAHPVVLLHAFSISGTMWYQNVADLSRSYRVYALDTIGDAGKSVCTRSLRTTADVVAWLGDVFSQLEVDSAHVVGISYGGFLALTLATLTPARVKGLALLAPAGSLLPFAARFYLRVIVGGLLPFRFARLALLRSLFATTLTEGAPVVEQYLLSKHFRVDLHVFPRVYADDELRQMKVPTLVLLGEREVIYDPRAALRRAETLMPNVVTALVPGAGHALVLDQPELVNEHLLAFLAQ